MAVAFAALSFSGSAQIIDDNFEFYNLGDMGSQNPAVWSNWSQDPSSSAENIIVSDAITIETQSGLIGDSGAQDALLLLGNLTSGDYTLVFEMYVPDGNEGYFNVQGEIPAAGALAGVWNSGDIYFNEGGANPGVGTDAASGDTWDFPHDEWFTVQIYFDVDNLTYQMKINGTDAHAAPVAFQTDGTLGAMDLFSASAAHTAYYDNILFVDGQLGADDFSTDVFSVYPNPVKDVLNINSAVAVDAIAVFDVLGKQVLAAQPGAISPSIDMSSLQSGAYLVQVTIGNATKTVKVIK